MAVIFRQLSSDATALDVWSLEQLKTLFRNSTKDLQLRNELQQDKVIFFLHLLGLDTTGHSYRPRSKVCTDFDPHLIFSKLLIGIHEQHPRRRQCRSRNRKIIREILW
jgi:hypothetical protein